MTFSNIRILIIGTAIIWVPGAWAQDAGDTQADEAGQATAADAKWDIEDPHAPTFDFNYDATEGTWMSVDVSPDGRTIAFDLLGHIYEMPAGGGTATALTEGRSWNLYPRYSPDGSEISFSSDRSGSEDIWVLTRANDELKNLSESKEAVVRGRWSADGRHIYATQTDTSAANHMLQINRQGGHQKLIEGNLFSYMNQPEEDPARGVIYYEKNDAQLPLSGARIYTYDLKTGESQIFIDRPGGAFNPNLSPDGRMLAYMGRDDTDTVLILRDLDTRAERVLLRGLDRDQMENGPNYLGIAPGIDWHPDGKSIYIAVGGKIRRVDVTTGEATVIPFTAPVRRKLNQTLRVKTDVPEGAQRSRVHRFARRTSAGILHETLGDIFLTRDGDTRNLTNSPAHESGAILNAAANRIYYVSWTDDDLGEIYTRRLNRGGAERLTNIPSQYGSLAVGPDDATLAYIRGRGTLRQGERLEDQGDFELVIRRPDGSEQHVTDISPHSDDGAINEVRRPPAVMFSPDGTRLYFSEFDGTELVFKSIKIDGTDELELYRFPNATRAVPSPDLKWIAFREYHRSYLTPFDFAGKPVKVSGEDKTGTSTRLHKELGAYLAWSSDSQTVSWTRGAIFYEKSVDDILAESDSAVTTDLSREYEVAIPDTLVALTGVRVVTADAENSVLENATILVRGNRIEAVGTDVTIPDGATRYDLAGDTIMPGIIDSHAHYSAPMGLTNVIEQRVPGLLAALSYGVTTMYELYGTNEKDFWISDMIRKGAMTGPRLYSVGTAIYGERKFRPGLYRSINSFDDAKEHLAYNQAFGATAIKDYAIFFRAKRHQLVTAARELGLNVVAESAAQLQMNLTQVVDGETGIEHSMGMTPLYDDVRAMFAASDIGITPTLIVVYNGPSGELHFFDSERVWENEKLQRFLTRDQLYRGRRPPLIWPDEEYGPTMARALKALYDAGVPLHVGGHGQMPGLDAHWEMELFQLGGFQPIDIIRIATINGATYFGLDEDLGSIEPSKIADLVIMSEDPLDDIANARAIRYVMKNGVLYDGKDAARIAPDPEPWKPMYFHNQ